MTQPNVATVEPRFRRRMPCSLRIAGKEHRALVLNLSRGGLFVRTTARILPGTRIELDLLVDGAPGAVPLCANVVWRRLSTSTISQMNEGGLGLRLADIPAAYDAFVRELSGPSPPEHPPPVASASPRSNASAGRFDVRLKQHAGPRSRWLQVEGYDEAAARTNALSSAGQDWEILEVRRAS